jgi:hypothetical protein
MAYQDAGKPPLLPPHRGAGGLGGKLQNDARPKGAPPSGLEASASYGSTGTPEFAERRAREP